jgi:hypothetical protein
MSEWQHPSCPRFLFVWFDARAAGMDGTQLNDVHSEKSWWRCDLHQSPSSDSAMRSVCVEMAENSACKPNLNQHRLHNGFKPYNATVTNTFCIMLILYYQ